MSETNRQVRLAQRPVGEPDPEVFEVADAPVPEPGDGEMLVKVLYISVDPAMRGWMNEGRSYIQPVQLGDVMRAGAVGRVVRSNNEHFAAGDYVTGMFGVQHYAVSDGKGVTRVDPSIAPLERYLGVLGMPGMTAYFGLLEVGRPQEGDVVLVSGAAGAVGATVGQIAKIRGCTAVGIAGGRAKCDLAREMGFDDVIDYKAESIHDGVKRACPKGVDVFFDNVGGEALEAALARLRLNARVVLCGAISQYNNTDSLSGPRNYMSLLVNRARMEGFVVFDYASRYGEAAREMAQWIGEGRLHAREHVVDGIEDFHGHLMMLFRGENFGKLVIRAQDE
ncbi:NADP-dependent oxidoreductase [Aquisalimonas lutea]|uniref:NADP-dependent oxidoreductase n=1 Tax=Aquisalimonas lutea TaxID=1327750 RepID=UPI0025B58485|nr:NADP-dependent oxidoreductase [Aquisalimonas lutea]MDN3519668.1 NADP-dependent oxidoreductase [Aquisalimonas lutea]